MTEAPKRIWIDSLDFAGDHEMWGYALDSGLRYDVPYVCADLVRELVKVALSGRDLAEFEGDLTTASDIAKVVNKINAMLGVRSRRRGKLMGTPDVEPFITRLATLEAKMEILAYAGSAMWIGLIITLMLILRMALRDR